MAQMPPEIVRQFLRATVDFPAAQDVKFIVVKQENSPRASTIRRTERADVNAFWSTMDRVWTGISGSGEQLGWFHRLNNSELPDIRLSVNHMNSGGAYPWNNQIPSLHVRMGRVRTERSAACVPAKVMKLVTDIRELESANDLAPARRCRIDVNNQERVGA